MNTILKIQAIIIGGILIFYLLGSLAMLGMELDMFYTDWQFMIYQEHMFLGSDNYYDYEGSD